nr:protein NYNRIN-like [Nerophis lumbriciformis]
MEMLRATRMETARPTREERLGRDRRRAPPPASSLPRPWGAAPERPSRPPQPKCYVCGHPDHMSWACPECDRDVSMATAPSSDAGKPCLHTGSGRRQHASLPVKIGGTDAHALLDSGSAVTLVHADFAGPLSKDTVPVTCVHGDVRQYPVSHIHIQTPRGDALVPAGVVPNLPVPLLIGSDCVLFGRYWTPGFIPGPRQGPHRVTVRLNRSDGRVGRRRRQKRKGTSLWSSPYQKRINPKTGEFATAQWNDQNLSWARQQVVEIDGQQCEGLGAHLGVQKTYDRIITRFYWPGVKRAIEDFCKGCPECQKNAPRPTYRNPLVPLPIISTLFSRLAMDIVGPLPKSARGHRYILVILDYATRYPEAVQLRTASAKAIAHELFMMFSRVGIADEILTDQGKCFMSQVLTMLYKWLKVKRIRTSVYHPQTDGLVERFNYTLKKMLKKLADEDGKDWDHLIPYVLFAIREVLQASTGFSPFELVYGRRPRGVLDIAKETWENQPSPHRSVI